MAGERANASAIARGRTLNPYAVAHSRECARRRLKELSDKKPLTRAGSRELRNLNSTLFRQARREIIKF